MASGTPLQRAAVRMVDRLHRQLGEDLARLRVDSGLSQRMLAAAAGVNAGYLSRIEQGSERPSLATLARLSAGLGVDLSVRLYPNSGPTIRDRHQAAIAEAILAERHPRWRTLIEIGVRRPVKGWIDLGLHDPRAGLLVAIEIQSRLGRLEQELRWATSKAEALPSWVGWDRLEPEPTISSALVVRDTRSARAVARDHERLLRAAFPAHPDDALASITGTAPWPGPAMIWATRARNGTGYRLVGGR